jgi:hypothetical protein
VPKEEGLVDSTAAGNPNKRVSFIANKLKAVERDGARLYRRTGSTAAAVRSIILFSLNILITSQVVLRAVIKPYCNYKLYYQPQRQSTTHYLRPIRNGRDAGEFVVTQTSPSSSCSLIAIFNILVLRGDIKQVSGVSDDYMIEALQNYLDEKDHSEDDMMDVGRYDQVKRIIPSLKGGLKCAPSFTDPTKFSKWCPGVELIQGSC